MTRALTREERAQIEHAIAQIRERSGVDCHVMVMPISDRYPLYPLLCAGLGALAAATATALLKPAFDGRTIIFVELAVLIVLSLIFDWRPLRIAITPTRVKEAHARQLAHRAFATRVETAKSHGVMLLFIAVAEHYVELIADHATHARVGGEVMDRIVAQLTACANRHEIGAGLLAALEALGAALDGAPLAAQD